MSKKRKKVEKKDTVKGRIYLCDGREYVSVTTPLSITSTPYLDVWKRTIGKSKAELIGLKASKYGTTIHTFCQKLCEGEKVVTKKYNKIIKGLKSWIRNNIEETIDTEMFVKSDIYGLAGTLDFIGKVKGYDGISIIDWKTGRIKKEHYLQMAAYAKLIKEYKGIDVSHRLIGDIKKPSKRKKTIILKELKDDNLELMEKDFKVYLNYLAIWWWMKGEYYEC